MKKTQYTVTVLILLISGLSFSSCKKNFTNPGATQFGEAFSSSAGLTGIAVGLQKQYSVNRTSSLYNMVAASGFSGNELRLMNAGNTDELNLSVGGISVDGNNGIVGNLWAQNLKVIFDANNVITNAANLGDKGYASGLIAYASIFKALAYGGLSMYWEQVPDSIGENVGFVNRSEGFKKAIATINNALATISANAISTAFTSNLPAGIEIPNTLQALKARYLLFSNDYSGALSAANAVNLSNKSTLNFDAVSPNPIFTVATATNNVFQVIDSSFGLPETLAPLADDKRIAFYMSINNTIAPRWRIKGFGETLSTPWPIYLPGEITLIKAECYARQASPSLPNAITEINTIRTKAPAADAFGVGAEGTPYAGAVTTDAILTEIYRQRCIELYMSGLKMEDMRRFNRPDAEKKRNLLPYPFRERDNNPNTPADPSF